MDATDDIPIDFGEALDTDGLKEDKRCSAHKKNMVRYNYV